MTIEEFLVKLAETKDRGWRVRSPGNLLRDQAGDCPINSVAGKLSQISWSRSAKELGLPEPVATAIADAADDYAGHDPALRTQLLSAVGL